MKKSEKELMEQGGRAVGKSKKKREELREQGGKAEA